jgi:membrane protein implicated in regulation of membrane protease activity
MGQESLVGRTGIVRGRLSPSGIVYLGAEQWTAELIDGEESVQGGERVEVVAVQGLKLLVRKKSQ